MLVFVINFMQLWTFFLLLTCLCHFVSHVNVIFFFSPPLNLKQKRQRRRREKDQKRVTFCKYNILFWLEDNCQWSYTVWNNRNLKHQQRWASRMMTRSEISPDHSTPHAQLIIHMKFRTSKLQVCCPERTWVCIRVFTWCPRQMIYSKLLKNQMKVGYLFNFWALC